MANRRRRTKTSFISAQPKPNSTNQMRHNRSNHLRRNRAIPRADSENLWWKIFSQGATVLVLAGILIYGYVGLSYERFYGALAIDPADVGLTYLGVLTHSTGLIVTLAFSLTFMFIVTYLILWVALSLSDRLLRPGGSGSELRSDAKPLARTLAIALAVFVGVVGLAATPWQADAAADWVKSGKPVRPLKTNPPFLTRLSIHADPAIVSSTHKLGEAPEIESLRARKLFYMGTANGLTVLYDPSVQGSIYLPSSEILLTIMNCEMKTALPVCKDVYTPSSGN
jgi:hypothetical protein